ncbi:hypothetical protein LT493_02705 [Streptomyces tricolor]|nr:hypothetical protein [Streptomyces tricolor]
MSLSEAVTVDMVALFQVAPATAPGWPPGRPARWLRDTTGKPDPGRPLLQAVRAVSVGGHRRVAPAVDLTLPTVKDQVRESKESVRFRPDRHAHRGAQDRRPGAVGFGARRRRTPRPEVALTLPRVAGCDRPRQVSRAGAGCPAG